MSGTSTRRPWAVAWLSLNHPWGWIVEFLGIVSLLAARGLYAAEGFALVEHWPRYYRRPEGAAAAALVFARALP